MPATKLARVFSMPQRYDFSNRDIQPPAPMDARMAPLRPSASFAAFMLKRRDPIALPAKMQRKLKAVMEKAKVSGDAPTSPMQNATAAQS